MARNNSGVGLALVARVALFSTSATGGAVARASETLLTPCLTASAELAPTPAVKRMAEGPSSSGNAATAGTPGLPGGCSAGGLAVAWGGAFRVLCPDAAEGKAESEGVSPLSGLLAHPPA